jgi:hypothetical protein
MSDRIRIPPLAYLRTVWTIFWECFWHPFSVSTIDLFTGKVISRRSWRAKP